MIYRGCCDGFMRLRQPSECRRNVHQGYWALSPFALQKKITQCSANLTKRTAVICSSQFDSKATLFILKSLMRSWYCTSPPPSLVERGWWTKGPPLTAVRLASPGLFPQSLSSSGEWSIHPNWRWAPSQTENTKSEPIIIVLYCTPGRTLINSPPGLEKTNE